MLGLEVIAVIPFCVAAWRLSRKVAEQQTLIDQHETTINSQQEVLQGLASDRSPTMLDNVVNGKTLALGSVAVVGAMTLHYTHKLSMLRRNVKPPAGYQPTPALFEAEECIVCFGNRKDTFFSPCQHFSTCWPCSQRFHGKDCPVCRAPVEYTQFTFVS